MDCYCESDYCHPESDCPNMITDVASPTGPGHWVGPAGPLCVHCAGPVPSEYLTWVPADDDCTNEGNLDSNERECPDCGGLTYRAESVPSHGGSRQLYRHEDTERVTCPVDTETI